MPQPVRTRRAGLRRVEAAPHAGVLVKGPVSPVGSSVVTTGRDGREDLGQFVVGECSALGLTTLALLGSLLGVGFDQLLLDHAGLQTAQGSDAHLASPPGRAWA